MTTQVWAFKPLTELGGATGFVECEPALAETLIAGGHAQDPRVGALHLRAIEVGDAKPALVAPEDDAGASLTGTRKPKGTVTKGRSE